MAAAATFSLAMSPTLRTTTLMMLMLVAFVDDKADARVDADADADADVDFLTRGHQMMLKTTKSVTMLRLKRMRLKLMKVMLK